MNRKFFKSLRALYEPMLVLVVIASAALLIGALYYALKVGSRGRVSFDAAFNEVGGIKEGSSVLFKGMQVGAVGKMRYDAATDKILVRIEITKQVDVPAKIKPYVEKSLMGQSNIALRTEQQTGTKELLADVVRRHQPGDKDGLYRIDGVELSRAESLMPELAGLDTRAQTAMTVATDTMKVTTDTMVEMKELAGDWRKLSAALIDGKEQTVSELEKVTATLDKAGQAVVRSEPQFRKLGIASEKLSDASDSVKVFMDMIKVKPNALIWGMSEQQRAMLNQQEARHSKPSGAGKR